MRLPLILIFTLGLLFPLKAQETVRAMTFNIRYNNPGDGENAWPKRIPMVKSMLDFYHPDVLGVQEALPEQMEALQKMMPAYASYGIARSEKSPEFCGIFYLRHKFELLGPDSYGTFWLAPDWKKEARGWDAALPRIASWVKLRSKKDSSTFLFINTHFDHRGKEARRESARLIAQLADSLRRSPAGELPVVLLGDFNATPEAAPIRILIDSCGFVPAYSASALAHHGPSSTWSGWKYAGETDRRIDHIFTRGNVGVLRHAILSDSWSGRFPSDHLPVMADLIFDPVKYHPKTHAHNDYEHERPLRDALDHGFASVEADVWAVDWKEDGGRRLIVSHNRPGGLKTPSPELHKQSLEALYLEPLAEICYQNQGRVYPFTQDAFWLMIDVKTEDADFAFEVIMERLEPYAWMLTGENPPVRIFLSGNRNLELIRNEGRGWVSIDGRPENLGQGYTSKEMPVISQHYRRVLNWDGKAPISKREFDKLRELTKKAHSEGKKVRLWASPEKEEVWKTLIEAGVDLINTDELDRAQAFFLENELLD